MSLQVWLPLNGDLHNQGLSNITITNNGATVNTSGKIGSCYSFNGSNNYLYASYNFYNNRYSVCAWIYTTSSSATQTIICDRTTVGSGFSIFLIGGKIRIDCGGNSLQWTTAYTYPINTWFHLTVTYDGNIVYYYINGEFKEKKTQTLASSYWGTITSIGASQTNGSGYGNYFNGKMNDVRIYDHALSVKEVEEIAKGLVLHYKLDQGNSNLLSKYVTPGQATPGSTATGGRTIYNGDYSIIIPASENADTYFRLFLTQQLIQGKTYTISCYVSGLLNGSYYRFPLFAQNNTSMGVLQLDHNGLCSLTFTMNSSAQNSTTAPDGSTVYICFMDDSARALASGQGQITLFGFKLEEGDLVTSWVPSNLMNIIYDSSGYSNNGTIVGSLETAIPSPRYSCATKFDGNTSCIKIPYNEINPDRIFTVNLWFHKDALGSKNYETLFGGPSGFEMDTRSGASTTLSLYMASVRGGNAFSPFNLNEWYMVTMVRNGTNEMYYINGELKKTIEAKSMPSGQYRIGAWASDTGQNYYGDMSDFRIYATALTPEQIKELYNTSMSIDNNGNIHARELVEL